MIDFNHSFDNSPVLKPWGETGSTNDIQAAAQAACDAAGIVYRNCPADGNWHVTDSIDKPPKNGNGRIKPFTDGTGGMVQNWGLMDRPEVFFIDTGVKLSPAELAERVLRVKAERERADKELADERLKAAVTARSVIKAAVSPSNNPYLVRKKVDPTATLREISMEALEKIIGYKPYSKGKPFTDGKVLIVPVRNHQGMTTLEMIDDTGRKAGLKGGQKKGGFWSTGKLPGGDGTGLTIGIGEGVATMLTYRQATGCTGIAALSCGNLKAVAEYFRSQHPAATIVIVSDVGNGEQAAVEAAQAVNGLLVKPTFPEGSTGSDINDLYIESGIEAVKSCLEAADNKSAKLWPEAVDLRELAKKDPTAPRFIMPGWLPCGYATMLSGHGGAGKSSISLVLIVCMALGLSFYGNPVEQRKVLFLSCEDRIQVLHWRLSHICRFFGVSIEVLFEHLFILDLVGYENILYQPGRRSPSLTSVYQELSSRIKQYGTQVLVVDGISDTFDGNENSRAEPKAFVNSLLALIPPDDGALILLGHVAKASANNAQTNEGYSGSTAWHNAVRARWYLYPEAKLGFDKRQEPTGKLILELQKSNLGKADKSMCFEWDDAAHMFAHIEIVEESHFDKNYRETKERNEILSAIVNCTVDIPAACSGPRTAFHVLAAQPDFPFSASAGSTEKKRFWQHIETLRAKGMLENDCITRADRHKVITLVATDKAITACGHAGIDKNDIPRTIAAPAIAGMRALPQGGYKGGHSPAHSEPILLTLTESDFEGAI